MLYSMFLDFDCSCLWLGGYSFIIKSLGFLIFPSVFLLPLSAFFVLFYIFLISDEELTDTPAFSLSAVVAAETANHNGFASQKARMYKKATCPKQRFVHFGPVTEIDHQKWEKLSIARAATRDEIEEEAISRETAGAVGCSSETSSSMSVSHVKSIDHTDNVCRTHANSRYFVCDKDKGSLYFDGNHFLNQLT